MNDEKDGCFARGFWGMGGLAEDAGTLYHGLLVFGGWCGVVADEFAEIKDVDIAAAVGLDGQLEFHGVLGDDLLDTTRAAGSEQPALVLVPAVSLSVVDVHLIERFSILVEKL